MTFPLPPPPLPEPPSGSFAAPLRGLGASLSTSSPTTTAPRARAPAGGKADATPLTNSPPDPWLVCAIALGPTSSKSREGDRHDHPTPHPEPAAHQDAPTGSPASAAALGEKPARVLIGCVLRRAQRGPARPRSSLTARPSARRAPRFLVAEAREVWRESPSSALASFRGGPVFHRRTEGSTP